MLHGGQWRAEIALCHFVGRGGKLFQGLGDAADGKVAYQEYHQQSDGDKEYQQASYRRSKDIDAEGRYRQSQRPVGELDGRIEHIRRPAVEDYALVFFLIYRVLLLFVFGYIVFLTGHHLPGHIGGKRVGVVFGIFKNVLLENTVLLRMHEVSAIAVDEETVD